MRLLPYLILLAEVVLFYRHVLFLGHVIPWDLGGFFLAHAHAYADALRSGELPLWDPYTYCGRPLQANIQVGVFYPPMALVAWLGGVLGHEHLRYLLELNVIFHVLLAGVFSYWLGLALGLSRPAALLLGTTYQLGGFFAAHAEHMTAVQVAAWIPFALYCIVRWKDGSKWRSGLLLAGGFAMAILAGLATLTAALFAISLVFAALLVLIGGARWKLVGMVAVAVAAAVVLTLVQLIPTIQLTNLSIAQYRSDYLQSGGGLPLRALVSLAIPNYNGVFQAATYRQPVDLTFMYLYSGWPALLLAAAALLRRASRLTAVFGVLLLITGLIALGDSTPIGKVVLLALPLKIRIGLEPEYVASAFLLCIATLAALGLDGVVRSPRWRWGIVAVAAVELIAVSSGHEMNAMPRASDPSWSRSQFEGDARGLDQMRKLAGHSNPPDRFDTTGGAMNWAMAAPSIALPSANGNDPFALVRLMQVRLSFTKGERWGSYYEVQDLRSPVLGMMNVHYLISRRAIQAEQLAASLFVHAEDLPGYLLYENPKALPRFWLVSHLRNARSEAEAISLLRAVDFQPDREAIVEGFPALPPNPPTTSGTVQVVHYGMNDVSLRVVTRDPQYLATSEVHYPGWKAFVDGQQQPLYYTNVAFRGLPIPAGEHTVEMRFTPASFWWPGAVSLAAWLLWGILWWFRGRRKAVAPGQD